MVVDYSGRVTSQLGISLGARPSGSCRLLDITVMGPDSETTPNGLRHPEETALQTQERTSKELQTNLIQRIFAFHKVVGTLWNKVVGILWNKIVGFLWEC